MMDKDDIVRIARERGITNNEFIEKDYYIDLVLYEISKLNLKVVFKGGTALYKIYGIPRFSEDLDFAVLEDFDIGVIMGMADRQGFGCEHKKYGTSLFVKLSFNGFLTGKNRLRIDFSRLHRPISYSLKSYISPYIDVSPFMVNVLDRKEILAEKIHAIYHRNSARDMYDLFYLLRIEKPDTEIILKKVPEYDPDRLIGKLKKYEKGWDREIRVFAMEYVDFAAALGYIEKNIR